MYEKLDSLAKHLAVHKIAPRSYAKIKASFTALARYQRVSKLSFSLLDKLKFLVCDGLYGARFGSHFTSRKKLLKGVRFLDECFNSSVYHRANFDDLKIDGAIKSWAEEHFLTSGFQESKRLSSSICLTNSGVSSKNNFQSFIANLERNTMAFFDETLPSSGSNLSNLVQPLVPWNTVQTHIDNLTIIVPVYEGYEETVACLNSLKDVKTIVDANFLIINDASPNGKINKFVKSFCHKTDGFELMENEENYGFTKTINIGLKSTIGDVIILNSDTVVTDYWLDRLVFHRATNRSAGTITPFSNNATICSFPVIGKDNPLLFAETPNTISEALYSSNRGASVEIPTGHGFCLYMTRECVKAIGLFNSDLFGHGYAEENDFCMRASNYGFKNIHALDVFIYHSGHASFSTMDITPDANLKKLRKKYPDYMALVAEAFEQDLAKNARDAAVWRLAQLSKQKKALFVGHNLGGGTDVMVSHTAQNTLQPLVFILKPIDDFDIHTLNVFYNNEPVAHIDLAVSQVVNFLDCFEFDAVEMHHFLGLHRSVIEALLKPSNKVTIYLHDLIWICPFIFGVAPGQDFCGFPKNENECTSCLIENSPKAPDIVDISEYRRHHLGLLKNAGKVVCATQTITNLMSQRFPGPNYIFDPTIWQEYERQWIKEERDFSVKWPARHLAVLGNITDRKGKALLESVAPLLKKMGVKFTIVGSIDSDVVHFSQTGCYEHDGLPDIITKLKVDAFWIPSTGIETFSLTLSEALSFDKPVLVCSQGVLIERASQYEHTYLVDHMQEIEAVAKDIVSILDGKKPSLSHKHKKRRLPKADKVIDTSPAKPVVVGLPTTHATKERIGFRHMDPCGYIRVGNLFGGQKGNPLNVQLHERAEEGFFKDVERSDLVLINRDSIQTPENLERLMKTASEANSKVIFDIDDYIFSLDSVPESERAIYQDKVELIEQCCGRADVVLCSTNVLKDFVSSQFNADTYLVENRVQLDWFADPSEQSDSDLVNIVYFGTRSHKDDIAALDMTLVKLAKKYSERVKISIAGVMGHGDRPRHWPSNIEILDVPAYASISYRGFCHWLSKIPDFQIGLAPLVDVEFNSYKSSLKALEIAACGAVPICSAGFDYDVLKKSFGEGIVLVEAFEQWFDVIDALIADNGERQKVRGLAKTGLDLVQKQREAAVIKVFNELA